MRISSVVLAALLVIACSGKADSPSPSDSTPAVAVVPDTLAAAALRDSAQATLATLLIKPATATFDSVVVVQPPPDGDRLPAMAVCGRIGGRPGIAGRATPTRFVYQNKWALFVEDVTNQAEFATLWASRCAESGGVVVVRG